MIDSSSKIDGMLEVFDGEGDHWSFIEALPDNRVGQTTEKIRISNLCSNGLYYFRSVDIFSEAYEQTYLSNDQKNSHYASEHYIAPIYNSMIKKGLVVTYKLVSRDDMLFCGTPDEYQHCLTNWRD